jgi:hypothetical protein
MPSPAFLVAAYSETGALAGAPSEKGASAESPYTDEEDAYTKWRTLGADAERAVP